MVGSISAARTPDGQQSYGFERSSTGERPLWPFDQRARRCAEPRSVFPTDQGMYWSSVPWSLPPRISVPFPFHDVTPCNVLTLISGSLCAPSAAYSILSRFRLGRSSFRASFRSPGLFTRRRRRSFVVRIRFFHLFIVFWTCR